MSIDVEAFQRRMLRDLTVIEESLAQAQTSAGIVTLDQSSVGRLSRMDAMQQQAMAQSMQERLLLAKRKIGAALARIDAGTYGQCCRCGANIEPPRLDSDPAAVFCIDCVLERDSDLLGREER